MRRASVLGRRMTPATCTCARFVACESSVTHTSNIVESPQDLVPQVGRAVIARRARRWDEARVWCSLLFSHPPTLFVLCRG